MAGGERNNLVTDGVKTLQLGSKIDGSWLLPRPSLVQGRDTNGITGSNSSVLILVVEYEGEHAIEVVGGIEAVFHILPSIAVSHKAPFFFFGRYNHLEY